MFRKGLVYLILVSMILHCASRMNVLSYLFEHRHEIALGLGIIDEIPIAVCHHTYEFEKGLNIETADDENSNLPAFSHAHEIILFFQTSFFKLNPGRQPLMASHFTMIHPKRYTPPGFAIFHPPA